MFYFNHTLQLVVVFVLMTCAVSIASAETINLLQREKDFVETGAENSLVKDRSLFRLRKNGSYFTESTDINIHSHYKARGSRALRNYTYTGIFRILDAGGGIGVTFYSDYPKSDTYYRLRMFDGGSFHIAPHPDGQTTLTGTIDTGVIPQEDVWYKFRIEVKTRTARTTIKAKVWPKGSPQPKVWQINCEDAGDNRISRGRPGVWSMGLGQKQWQSLAIIKP